MKNLETPAKTGRVGRYSNDSGSPLPPPPGYAPSYPWEVENVMEFETSNLNEFNILLLNGIFTQKIFLPTHVCSHNDLTLGQ